MTSTLKIREMVNLAVSLLNPIEFEVEGIDVSFLPETDRLPRSINKESLLKVPAIGFCHYGIPSVVLGSTAHHNLIHCYVENFSQKSINKALQNIWEQESEMIFSSSKKVTKYMIAQGSNYMGEIESLLKSANKKFTVPWEKFCDFSRSFTNGSYGAEFKKNYVYMDDSGGFKSRGAWTKDWELTSINARSISLSRIIYSPVEGESIDNGFGQWNAYALKTGTTFLFQSCNGNTLVGYVHEDFEVAIYVDNLKCNYAKFFGQ